MQYGKLKEKLISLFDKEKLQAARAEWGFFNEKDRNIEKTGYCVNISPEIIRKTHEAGVQFLLTHHDCWEFLFGAKQKCNELLTEYGITHAFFHAPLDDADFGTSASLAKAAGLKNIVKVMPYAEIFYGGVTGETAPVGFDAFSSKLAAVLGESIRVFKNNDRPVSKVAVAAGGGNMTGEIKIAVEAGCDTYITGEYALYSQQYAEFAQINLLVGSHTNTEIFGVSSMAQILAKDTDLHVVRIEEPAY